jgi:hypothetical protein
MQKENITPFFFDINNKVINNKFLSIKLRKISENYFNYPINISIFRDLIIYIIKTRIISNNPGLLNNNSFSSALTIENYLANHSNKITEYNYSRDSRIFSNSTRYIYNKSRELSLIYFQFFKMDTLTKFKELYPRDPT